LTCPRQWVCHSSAQRDPQYHCKANDTAKNNPSEKAPGGIVGLFYSDKHYFT
jgi:hypothetical protein